MFSTLKSEGNWILLFGFSVGSLIMTIVLFYQKRNAWKLFENIVTILVLACILAWLVCGPILAIIFGILSEVIVGVYLIIKTWRNPSVSYNLNGYSLFLVASILALLNAKSSEIEEVGYASAEIILTVLTIIPLVKKRMKE